MTIGELIRERREFKGWSIRRLSYKTNISRSMISGIENGIQIPRMNVAIELSKALGISLMELAECTYDE